ncbi:MAG: J domain-containing protein [Polyangia bacterium]
MFPKYERPLKWPLGWPRCAKAGGYRSGFDPKRSIDKALGELMRELRLLGAGELVFTANLRTGKQGGFLSDQPQPPDRGVAVWFKLPRRDGEPLQQVLACDRWDRVEHNLHAIALHVEAIRAQERYGVGTLEQAFKGYLALPAPAPRLSAQADELTRLGSSLSAVIETGPRADGGGAERAVAAELARHSCWQVLGLQPGASEVAINAAYRDKAALWHPDKGGTGEVMYVLNQMRDDALSHAEKLKGGGS